MPSPGSFGERFVTVDFVRGIVNLQVAANEAEMRLRLAGREMAADALLLAMRKLREQLVAMEREVAAAATEILRKWERNTRVRPDTHGGGDKRLNDYLVAEPLGDPLLPGTVGIADLEFLDNNVPWWITNEEGSRKQLGRVIYGVFYDDNGFSAPDRDQFREHPLFAPEPFGTFGAGIGTIKRPIPERRFVAKAVDEINALWLARFTAIRAEFDLAMTRALAEPR